MVVVKSFILVVVMACLADSMSGLGKASPVVDVDKDKYMEELKETARMRAERVRNKYQGRSPAIEQ